MEFRSVILVAVLIFVGAGCATSDIFVADFENEVNDDSVVDTYPDVPMEDDSIPYDPNAPAHVVHELKPVEADYRMRQQFIKESSDVLEESIPIIRWVRNEDRTKYDYQCLRSKGFNVFLDNGDIAFETYDKSELERYNAAILWCMAAYPTLEVMHRPLNPEQARILYRYYVEKVIPCLQDLGYSGPYNLPSEEKFVSGADKYPRYSPYPQVVPEEKYFEVIKTCPVRPGYEQIWGRY